MAGGAQDGGLPHRGKSCSTSFRCLCSRAAEPGDAAETCWLFGFWSQSSSLDSTFTRMLLIWDANLIVLIQDNGVSCNIEMLIHLQIFVFTWSCVWIHMCASVSKACVLRSGDLLAHFDVWRILP